MIKWSLDYSVNNHGIDNQHKVLIELINKVEASLIKRNLETENVLEIVHELDNYVIEHFSYEESLMKQYNYPDSADHLLEHEDLRKKMKEINIFSVENTDKFYMDMLEYLINWLVIHIKRTDYKLASFLLDKEE